MLKARNSFVNYKNQQELWNWIKNSHQMGFSLGTRALSLLQFTVCPNMQMSLWVFYAARFGSRFVVGSGSSSSSSGQSGSGQRPAVRALFGQAVSPHFTYIWYLYLVFVSTFFTFFLLFRSCFGPSERATHGTNWTTRPPEPPPECVPNTLCAGPLTQFSVVPVPAASTLQLQLEALFRYEHAHSGTRKYAHTSPYLFICEWTNTRQKCVWNF